MTTGAGPNPIETNVDLHAMFIAACHLAGWRLQLNGDSRNYDGIDYNVGPDGPHISGWGGSYEHRLR